MEIVVSDGSRSYQAAIAQYLPDARHVLDRFHVARWFTEGLTLVRREIQRRPPDQRPLGRHTNRTYSEPASLSCVRAGNLTDAHQEHLNRLFAVHPRLRTAWDALQELYRIYEADDLDGANEALGRFGDLYATGKIPEHREIVDTIIARGEEILAYHTSRRASNGPLEGINNLHPGPTPRRSRVHQLRQLRSPLTPCNMTPTPAPERPNPTKSRSLLKSQP